MSNLNKYCYSFGLMLCCLTGCLFGAGGRRSADYDWGIWNASDLEYSSKTRVTYKDVEGNERELVGGANAPGCYCTTWPGPSPLPKSVHVHVDRSSFNDFNQGKDIDVDLKVEGNIPDEAHLPQTVWVVVTNNGVYLAPESEAQQEVRRVLDGKDNVAGDKHHVPTTLPSEKTTPDKPVATSQP